MDGQRLATGAPIKGYNGFDPTGSSLHIGHLVPIFGLIHLQRAGGAPVVLVGGGTAMIGDPSGRSAERLLLSRPTVEENVVGIQAHQGCQRIAVVCHHQGPGVFQGFPDGGALGAQFADVD